MKTFISSIGLMCALLTGALAGFAGSQYLVIRTLDNYAKQDKAQVEVEFTEKDQALITVPSIVHGQRVNCLVYVSTLRKISTVLC